jgi:hypothetical protein
LVKIERKYQGSFAVKASAVADGVIAGMPAAS